MKQVVTVTEVDGEGFDGMLGERVTVWCLNYIYAGKLVGVSDKYLKLQDASIVYETGNLTTKGYSTSEKFINPVYIMQSCIESFTLEY